MGQCVCVCGGGGGSHHRKVQYPGPVEIAPSVAPVAHTQDH